MENKQGGIMENIKIGDVMVFEGRVTRISKEDGKCFLRSKYDGNWFFMNSLKHKHQSVTEENIKEYAGAYKKHFVPPTVDEVKAYCQERNNKVDPQKFVDFYECKGWMVGKNHMKDWKAAVRSWETRWKEEHGGGCNGSAGESAKKWNIPGEVVL